MIRNNPDPADGGALRRSSPAPVWHSQLSVPVTKTGTESPLNPDPESSPSDRSAEAVPKSGVPNNLVLEAISRPAKKVRELQETLGFIRKALDDIHHEYSEIDGVESDFSTWSNFASLENFEGTIDSSLRLQLKAEELSEQIEAWLTYLGEQPTALPFTDVDQALSHLHDLLRDLSTVCSCFATDLEDLCPPIQEQYQAERSELKFVKALKTYMGYLHLRWDIAVQKESAEEALELAQFVADQRSLR